MAQKFFAITLTISLFSLVFTHSVQAGGDHHEDFVVGRSSANQLKFEYDGHLEHAILLDPISGLLRGWTGTEPGFDALSHDHPSEDFYQLAQGAQIRLEVVGIDTGLKVWQSGLGGLASAPGERILLGGSSLHNHPIWHIDSDIVGTDWIGTLSGTFKLVDTGSTGYLPSEAFTMHFTNVPEPASLVLLGVGMTYLVRRRRS